MTDRTIPFFVLGAGFGADAGAMVGPIDAESVYIGKYQIHCAYPLVGDLSRICFPDAAPPIQPEDVERRLGEALDDGNHRPVTLLCEQLAKADYYLAPPLVGWPRRANAYMKFFADFPDSSFATFNYDAFVELALFRLGRWSPHDGFGVEVAVGVGHTATPYSLTPSHCLVLHLHGSYLIYTYEHQFGVPDGSGVRWMETFEHPKFAFDPQSSLFYPCERVMAGLAYNPMLHNRIVAPVPNKATGLKEQFLQSVRTLALQYVAATGTVVAIGYSFAASDAVSYSRILSTLNDLAARLVLVAPDASTIVERLKHTYPSIAWIPQDLSFASWVESGYGGLQTVRQHNDACCRQAQAW